MTLIRNSWYVAALSEEVGDGILARTILNDPIILHRSKDGSCSALLGICPHRFAPLGMGMMKDGNIQCPYHGLEFDGSGRCVHNPHGNGARPASLNLYTYPVVERDGLVWIWMGEFSLADASAIPDYSCRVAPDRRTIGGHATINCNYRLLVDNLMDLGHAQYVHRANAQSDAFDKVRRDVVVEGGTIRNLMMFPEGSPTKFLSNFLDPSIKVIDQWNDIRWNAVGSMLNFIAFAAAGTPKEQSHNSMGTHNVTPETETSCHYFFGASRNFAIADAGVDETFRAWQKQALLLEDKPMVEAIEGLRDTINRHAMRPAMLACDAAAVRVSFELDKLEKAQAALAARASNERSAIPA